MTGFLNAQALLLTALVAKTEDAVNLKVGLLSNRACTLRNSVKRFIFHVNTTLTNLLNNIIDLKVW